MDWVDSAYVLAVSCAACRASSCACWYCLYAATPIARAVSAPAAAFRAVTEMPNFTARPFQARESLFVAPVATVSAVVKPDVVIICSASAASTAFAVRMALACSSVNTFWLIAAFITSFEYPAVACSKLSNILVDKLS